MMVRAFKNLARGYVTELALFTEENGKRYVASRIEYEQVNKSATMPPPLVTLEDNEAQRLMDDLWNAGFRPTDAKVGSELIKAKDDHIAHLWQILEWTKDR